MCWKPFYKHNILLICILGYNGDKWLNLNSSENLDKFGKASANWANESGTQTELIDAKKRSYQNLVGLFL